VSIGKPGTAPPIVEKRIAIVGVSDEETAHLRLLMRKAGEELAHRWTWSNESAADLVVVDPSSFAGQMARTRAQSGGLRCAVFGADLAAANDLVLQRPLKLANVVDVLNSAGGSAPTAAPTIDPHRHDFYFRDVGEESHDAPIVFGDVAARRTPDAAPGLEELLRVDPHDVREATRVKSTLDDATVFGVGEPTARSETRLSDSMRHNRPAEPVTRVDPAKSTNAAPTRKVRLSDNARHPLRDYLDGDLLGGPARIVLDDAPALVLDPKQKVFHTPGALAKLEPYCRTALRVADFQPLTTSELAELRIDQPPQPYARLIWLDVLLRSNGQLARHLDPGGTYRLIRWIEIERDFSSYFRIASSMLQPARLHEIAAASGAAMSDVFDVVNAYDAIGLIEWTPRAPRESDPKPERGLLGRLFRK
jgi:hypothetical protein